MADQSSLQRSEFEPRLMMSVLEQGPGFTCFLRDRELVFEFANAAYRRLIGRREVVGKPLRRALPELEGRGYFELLEQVFDTGEPFVERGVKVLLISAAGELEEAHVDFIYQPITNADGSTAGILVHGYDVTAVHHQATERESSERRYRALFESIDDGFCIVQMLFDEHDRCIDYRYLEVNAAFEEHTGLSNAVGSTARELVPNLDESWFRLYGQVALTGERARFENHAPAMNRWFEVNAHRFGAPEQRQVALVFKNITARKLAELEVAESEARLRNMVDHAPVMLWVTDADGQRIHLNRQWYDFTGQTPEAGLGLGWLDAVHPDDAADVENAFLLANAAQRAFAIEYRLQRPGGEHHWVIDSASPRVDSEGSFVGYIGSVIDISARKRIEEEREQLLRRAEAGRFEAEQANRLKDEFLATVSHELRTPLNAVLGWAQMLRSGTVPAERREHALETIERNARNQAQLVSDLLDISRILAGKLQLEVQSVSVDDIVAQALDTVRPAAEAKQIRLRATLDSKCKVRGDAARLQQVAWNVLSNAVKFTPREGRVYVVLTRRDSSVELSVADTGQGIEPELLPHVFERFRQADGTIARGAGGLGLGLTIAKHLVEAHGGLISVASDGVGKGALFTVRLPIAVSSNLAADVRSELGLVSSELDVVTQLEGLRVLVVDDESDTRDMLRELLESCKITVSAAGSVAEGLSILQDQPIDLLISDIGMPVEDGHSFIRKVRGLVEAEKANVPAVALTAHARAPDRARALLAGYNTHVPKPVEAVELLAVVLRLSGRQDVAR